MSDTEQAGPLWTDPVRAECSKRCAECGDAPCWKIPPGDGPVDSPYGAFDPCAECQIADLVARIREVIGGALDLEWETYARERPSRLTPGAQRLAQKLCALRRDYPGLFPDSSPPHPAHQIEERP